MQPTIGTPTAVKPLLWRSGTDYRQCFETFIADCDAFIEKIKTVRDQARTHMEAMLAAAKELESHEN